MAGYNAAPFARLIEQFERLPGIGSKTAQRLAYHVLRMPEKDAQAFAQAITDAHKKIHYCKVCCNLADGDLCPICKNEKRDRSTVCVVEDPKDVIALERTQEYKGVYHVLHGAISPLNGITPEQLKIRELVERAGSGEIKEVIMATNATAEGEVTAVYISKLLKPLGIKVTRIASGLPVGGDLEYADEMTLLRALEGRNEI